MADTKIEKRRLRTRPRSEDALKTAVETTSPSKFTITKESAPGLKAVEAWSHQTESTQQSYTMGSEQGGSIIEDIPLEVIIINDDAGDFAPVRGQVVNEDLERNLKKCETLIASYKDKLKSSENLNGALHRYLRQTQGYAENLLSEREELLGIIQDMEKEDNRRVDQELLLKFIMCTSLFFYMCGGSQQFLVGAVALQLLVTVVNMFV